MSGTFYYIKLGVSLKSPRFLKNFAYFYIMNTSDLKLNIIRQVDTLEDDILKEVIDYIQNKINNRETSVLDSLSIEQKNAISQAQQSIKDGFGIPHKIIVSKYKTKYGIS